MFDLLLLVVRLYFITGMREIAKGTPGPEVAEIEDVLIS